MFDFKQFSIDDSHCGMKVGTDSVLLGAWTRVGDSGSVLDLGCGSGLLALMIAQRLPEARIYGIDIDAGAVADAARNAKLSPWADRVSVTEGNALDVTTEYPYDLIVCNPPYYSHCLNANTHARADARQGLSGLSSVTAVETAARLLSEQGSLAMVTPADHEDEVTFAAEFNRLQVWRLCRVSSQRGAPPIRILWQIARKAPAYEVSTLDIRDEANVYTPEYQTLTSDFYLNF